LAQDHIDSRCRVLLITNFSEVGAGLRVPLLEAIINEGHQAHIAVPEGISAEDAAFLTTRHVRVHRFPLVRSGLSPLQDLRTLLALWKIMRDTRPTHVLPYTVKPVVYGLIAARLARVPHKNALITGAGYTLSAESTGVSASVRRVVRFLYWISLRRAETVIFQNPDDERQFRDTNLISSGTASAIVNGSGVDLDRFTPATLPEKPIRFLLIARFLGQKGVREYVSAARIVKRSNPSVEFDLVGWPDEGPDGIGVEELHAWIEQGFVNYLGRLSDVKPAIEACRAYVLPSYSEGTPRTVLEAMAVGRPIVTTDAPGCRETVVDGLNGFLVRPRSVDDLVAAVSRLARDHELARIMGERSRELAVGKYDVHKVNRAIMSVMGLLRSPDAVCGSRLCQ